MLDERLCNFLRARINYVARFSDYEQRFVFSANVQTIAALTNDGIYLELIPPRIMTVTAIDRSLLLARQTKE